MRILSLELTDYRNYARAELRPCAGVTVLAGDNAQGKTNLLEAVYLCCTGRSHRTRQDRELVRWARTSAAYAWRPSGATARTRWTSPFLWPGGARSASTARRSPALGN